MNLYPDLGKFVGYILLKCSTKYTKEETMLKIIIIALLAFGFVSLIILGFAFCSTECSSGNAFDRAEARYKRELEQKLYEVILVPLGKLFGFAALLIISYILSLIGW